MLDGGVITIPKQTNIAFFEACFAFRLGPR